MSALAGKAYLVGAGPGDPGLVTLKARDLIEQAEVVVYDYLCNPLLLQWAPLDAEKIYAGKMANRHTLTQDEINALLVAKVRAGKKVVRLKGGDPYVFGRGGEEAQALLAAGCSFEEVPGITSPIAVPAYAGIPVTHRDFTSTLTFITGHEDPAKAESSLDWVSLGRLTGTRVFLMGVERVRHITSQLMQHGTPPSTPMALIRWGTTARQQTLTGTVATMADVVDREGFKPPAIIIVGEVVSLRETLNWFETRPLFGKRVVVTRTRTQASELTRLLTEQGADVLEISTIRVERQALPVKIREGLVGQMDWLVFTSPNAVDHFFGQWFESVPDVRALAGIRLAVVGPATARRLAALHLQADKQPEEFTAAGLARAFTAEEIRGKRFCLPRGDLASPELPAFLQQQGGTVEEWIVYTTKPETEDRTGARKRFLEEGADWVLFTSASTAENWQRLQLQPGSEARQPQYASIGPVTSAAVKQLGFSVALEAEAHTIPGVVDALVRETKGQSVSNATLGKSLS